MPDKDPPDRSVAPDILLRQEPDEDEEEDEDNGKEEDDDEETTAIRSERGTWLDFARETAVDETREHNSEWFGSRPAKARRRSKSGPSAWSREQVSGVEFPEQRDEYEEQE